MTSNNIYTAIDRTPYCYLIGWTAHNIWYYGKRSAKHCLPSDLWVKYKTSSTGPRRLDGSHTVESFTTEYGEPDRIEVRKIFNDVQECSKWETRFLRKVNAAKNPIFLNRSSGGATFDATGKVCVYDESGSLIQISKEDPRWISGTLKSQIAGTGIYRDADGRKYKVSTQDPRVISGEIFSIIKGMTCVKDAQGKTFMVGVNDPRFLSGEVTSVKANTVMVRDKVGNIFRASNLDPKYLSGEYAPFNIGLVSCVTESGEPVVLSKTDPRYISGEIKSALHGRILCKDLSGKVMRVSSTDSRWESGELVAVNISENRQKMRERPEVIELSMIACQRGIKISPAWKWTKDLSKYRELILNGPPNASYGSSKPKNTQEKLDIQRARMVAMRSRPEVLELKLIAKTKNIALRPSWEWQNDISKVRDLIVNGPSNKSYY